MNIMKIGVCGLGLSLGCKITEKHTCEIKQQGSKFLSELEKAIQNRIVNKGLHCIGYPIGAVVGGLLLYNFME